jgi:putative transposase
MFIVCSLMSKTEKPGWHNRGYLPHYDANTLVQHVVFRTLGSLPSYVLERLAPPNVAATSAALELALDQSCYDPIFSVPANADIMQAALRYFDGDRYDLQAWCIMPNHVHVVFVTNPDMLLGNIVKSWKRSVAWSINKARGQTGSVFAFDYFDRYMRNLRQAETAIHYVEVNPVKAGLCQNAADWPWSSAHHRAHGWRPKHNRLPLFLS